MNKKLIGGLIGIILAFFVFNSILLFNSFLVTLFPREYPYQFENYSELGKLYFRKSKNIERSVQISELSLRDNYSFQTETSDFPIIKKDIDKVWNSSFYNNSHKLYTYTISILWDLIYSHQYNHNKEYLLKGKNIVLSFIKYNSEIPFSNMGDIWNDHAASSRAINIIYFYCYSKDYINYSKSEIEEIEKILNKTIAFLKNDFNYTQNHNHGLFQDLALVIIANQISNPNKKDHLIRIANERFINQINYLISHKGIEIENSPTYHYLVQELYQSYLCNIQQNTLPDSIYNKISKSDSTASAFLDFHEKYYPIGDSNIENLINIPKHIPSYSLIDNEAGFSIFKKDSLHLVVRTKGKSSTHSHNDMMSYIFSNRLNQLVTETGFLDYTNSEDNKFTKSIQAHNTSFPLSVFENKNFEFTYDSSQVVEYVNNDNLFYIKIHSNNKNYSLDRSFFLLINQRILIVFDDIHKSNEKNWINCVNLNLTTKNHSDKQISLDNGFFLTSNNKINILEGDLENKSGLIAIPNKELKVNKWIKQDFVKTNIIAYSQQNPLENIQYKNHLITFEYLNKKYRIELLKNNIVINDQKYSIDSIETVFSMKNAPIRVGKKIKLIIVFFILIGFISALRIKGKLKILLLIFLLLINLYLFIHLMSLV